MIRILMAVLLTASVAAQLTPLPNVTLTVIDTEDTRIRLGVTDTLSPRPATLEVRTVPDGALFSQINGVTPAEAWLSGLEQKTQYDFTAIVGEGPSQEVIIVQAWTTWFGVSGRDVDRAEPLIAREIDTFLTTLAASAEVRGTTYQDALIQDLTAAFQAARAESTARRRAELEQQLEDLPEL